MRFWVVYWLRWEWFRWLLGRWWSFLRFRTLFRELIWFTATFTFLFYMIRVIYSIFGRIPSGMIMKPAIQLILLKNTRFIFAIFIIFAWIQCSELSQTLNDSDWSPWSTWNSETRPRTSKHQVTNILSNFLCQFSPNLALCSFGLKMHLMSKGYLIILLIPSF